MEPPAVSVSDRQRAGRARRGIYKEYCAACHGASGRDFSRRVRRQGDADRGDRHRPPPARLLHATTSRSTKSTLYAGYDWRFSHFRKTFGYANMPLDGLWLRAPYLHNGSVPTLRDLLEPAATRPTVFYRGYDVYDPVERGLRRQRRRGRR